MFLTGHAALSLLMRYRIPKAFGMTIDFESTETDDMAEAKRLCLTLAIDRERAAPVLTLEMDDRVNEVVVDLLHGLHNYQVAALANLMELPRKSWQPLVDAAQHLYRILIAADALSITLDPLSLESTGRLVLNGASINLDDSSNFRHPDMALGMPSEADDERLARIAGISYARLDGSIGVMANGAGLALATNDMVARLGYEDGLRPANFMDIGGGARADTVETGVRLLLNYHDLNAIIVNVFGGVTRADEVAQGILAACGESDLPVPLVLRLHGTHAQTGRARLEQAGLANLTFASTMMDAVRQALALAKG